MKSIQFDHYYLYEEMEEWLKQGAAEHPDKIRLESLAKTSEGRNLYLVKVADFNLGDIAEKRGAYYVQAGVHAEETGGTTAALMLIETLVNNSPDILKDVVFYIVPRVNPDGSEYAMTKCAGIRSKYEPGKGHANALIPSDINQDGRILNMRWRDPLGAMKEDENAPGIMLPREPDELDGIFYNVCTEGIIENYDGGSPVFGQREIDFNRSMPVFWEPRANSSDYPLRYPEQRAIAEFMVSHPNIFAGIDYHCGSNGILRPSLCPDNDLDPSDLDLILSVGSEASGITGLQLIREREYTKKPSAVLSGISNEWAYWALGISHYVIELGNGYNSIGLSTPEIKKIKHLESMNSRIRDYHEKLNSEIFVPWTPFEHPQLGSVEIGGFINGQSYYMPPSAMADIASKTTAFILKHALMGPKLKLENLEVLNLGGGIQRIRVELMNVGRFGTTVMAGSGNHNCKNIAVRLTCCHDFEILSRPVSYFIGQLRSLEKHSFEWFIKTQNECHITISAEHPKATPVQIYFNAK